MIRRARGPMRYTSAHMAGLLNNYAPGTRVRVTQQIPFAKGTVSTVIEGTILRFGQQKTGSWFAHGKDDKLWLDRLELKKADGELVVCNLDQYSHVEVLA